MLLALDTSTRTVGIALYDGLKVLAETVWTSVDHHTIELAPAVSGILEKGGASISDLQAVGVATGPGSFTGLRIGLALGKGIALARHIAIIGVPTLDFLAAAQPPSRLPLVAILQAGRGRLATQWYRYERGWQPEGELAVTTAEEISAHIHHPTWVCGELTENERRLLARKRKNVLLASPALCLRRPGFLAELAWRRWQAGRVDEPASLSPIYLHYGEPIPE